MGDRKMKLINNVALITGATGSIGQGICRRLADDKVNIVINYFGKSEKEKAVKLEKEIKGKGVQVLTIEADVSSYQDVEKMFNKIIDTFGKIDILVNNAGITLDGLVHELSPDNFNKVVSVNLIGSFFTSRIAVDHMMKNNYGRIINISSVAGLIGLRGSSAYASSKAGLIGLTKSIAREVARKGITANTICPGYINGGLMKGVTDEYLETMLTGLPSNEIGNDMDIANGVSFLSSPDSRYITGEVIRIDGGLAM